MELFLSTPAENIIARKWSLSFWYIFIIYIFSHGYNGLNLTKSAMKKHMEKVADEEKLDDEEEE